MVTCLSRESDGGNGGVHWFNRCCGVSRVCSVRSPTTLDVFKAQQLLMEGGWDVITARFWTILLPRPFKVLCSSELKTEDMREAVHHANVRAFSQLITCLKRGFLTYWAQKMAAKVKPKVQNISHKYQNFSYLSWWISPVRLVVQKYSTCKHSGCSLSLSAAWFSTIYSR